MEKIPIDCIVAQKMAFIYNALQDGWEVKKKGSNYVFKKKHGDRQEVFLDKYLEDFVRRNIDLRSIVEK
jgi:hypothetical protein